MWQKTERRSLTISYEPFCLASAGGLILSPDRPV